MKAQNEILRGKLSYLEPGTLIYAKDNRIVPKRKIKQRYINEPLLVLKDYGTVLLVKTFQGIVRTIHKDNVKICHPREYEQFESLPKYVKDLFGYPFTREEMREALEKEEIPEFYFQPQQTPKRPKTRSRVEETETDEEQALDSDDEEPGRVPPDTSPVRQTRVRFNV